MLGAKLPVSSELNLTPGMGWDGMGCVSSPTCLGAEGHWGPQFLGSVVGPPR